MTKFERYFAYIFYFIATLTVTGCLTLGWYMSPLGLGFATWPEANRDLLQHIYAASYFVGIPAILIAQAASPVLFIYRKRKAAYLIPAISIILFLACITFILSNLG